MIKKKFIGETRIFVHGFVLVDNSTSLRKLSNVPYKETKVHQSQ